jgi:hypothetical protein
MKVTTRPSEDYSFKPVELTLTIQTRAELEVLYQLGNYNSQVADCLKNEEEIDKAVACDVFFQVYTAVSPIRSKL